MVGQKSKKQIHVAGFGFFEQMRQVSGCPAHPPSLFGEQRGKGGSVCDAAVGSWFPGNNPSLPLCLGGCRPLEEDLSDACLLPAQLMEGSEIVGLLVQGEQSLHCQIFHSSSKRWVAF